jgi:hypothetical protein
MQKVGAGPPLSDPISVGSLRTLNCCWWNSSSPRAVVPPIDALYDRSVRLNLQLEEQLRKSFAALGKKRLYRAGLSTTGTAGICLPVSS